MSVAAVVLTAIFNVGYYSEIGLHFLGTIDVTNFVYTVGLVFGILIAVVQAAFLFAEGFLSFTERQDAWIKFRKWYLIAAIVIVIFMGLDLVPFTSYEPKYLRIGHPWRNAISYSVFAVLNLMANYIWFRVRAITLSDLGILFYMMAMAVFSLGQATAYNQIFSSSLYDIATRSGDITGAALVRSSSMGFIVSVNGKILFIPVAEVRQITSEKNIEQ
jgi:hypothetical protein